MNWLNITTRRGLPTARLLRPGLGSLTLLLQLAAPGLAAQDTTRPALPVIEPRLTRIIGSDTLQIREPALSPDGRWVAFSQTTSEIGSLWIVSSAGGEPRRLIDAANVQEPVWFPEGDRIAYFSSEISAIMTVPFDTRLGRVSGRPQRVTLEPAARWFRLSPDGKWFAYRVWAEDGGPMGMIIKVIPANGGTARTLGARAEMIFLMDWSADGKYIYYGARTSAAQQGQNFRVAVDGGAPELVRQLPAGESAPLVPYFVVAMPGDPAAGPPFLVVGYDAHPVARIALPQNAAAELPGRGLTSDGRHLLAVVSNTASPMRVLPVAGGAPRQLGEARAPEIPLGWSPDGNEVLFATQLDGRLAIMSAPVTGGAAREVGPMPDRGPPVRVEWANPITFSADGRFLTYSRPTPESADRTLVVRPVTGGEERIVTSALFQHSATRLAGPGGTPNIAGDDFLYLERRGDRVELRATPPEGTSRLIRSFAMADVGRAKPKGVFEDRVAYRQDAEPSTVEAGRETSGRTTPARILVARGASGAPKEVASVPGVWGFDDLVWSPDGRWIAGTAYVNAGTDDYTIKILVVGVTPEGDVSSPARLIDTPIIYAAWGLQWLPDGSAVTLTGQSPPNGRFDIWFVPVRNEGRPVALTRDDRDGIGYNVLSPDGRYVAYRADVERGTSLWLADLGDALARLR